MEFIAHYGFYAVCSYTIYVSLKAHIAWKQGIRERKQRSRMEARMKQMRADDTMNALYRKVLLRKARENVALRNDNAKGLYVDR